MGNNDEYLQRKRLRLRNYDYSQGNGYFITIDVLDRGWYSRSYLPRLVYVGKLESMSVLPNIDEVISSLPDLVSKAVANFWATRQDQQERQKQTGKTDAGARSAVTGGKQLNGFLNLLQSSLCLVGVDAADVSLEKRVCLPGYY
ncbi:MAG: PaeR7I family type II restriction endonuclease, partial [bacterium]|nr:PaeR7I family type II restriction endonuclease [bacterium]